MTRGQFAAVSCVPLFGAHAPNWLTLIRRYIETTTCIKSLPLPYRLWLFAYVNVYTVFNIGVYSFCAQIPREIRGKFGKEVEIYLK